MAEQRPFHFGPPEARLFGVYHAPGGERERELGVLLCHPGPQEYLRCHRALRRLAVLLARAGFPVLRFDYRGTGDSAGPSGSGSCDQWSADIVTALGELRDMAGVRRVSLVGFRLGAALAARSAARVRDLVLWEPVLDGAAHVEELRAQHPRRFQHCLHPPGPDDLLGLPFPDAQRRDYEAVRLAPPLPCRAERVALVAGRPAAPLEAFLEALRLGQAAGGPRVEWHLVPEETAPAGDEPFLLSTRAQQVIASLLQGRAA